MNAGLATYVCCIICMSTRPELTHWKYLRMVRILLLPTTRLMNYRIARNFQTAKIFAYFEHMHIVQKLEPTEIFDRDYDITRFFLAWQLFVYYVAPDVPVNMTAAYHGLDGKRSMHHESNSSN